MNWGGGVEVITGFFIIHCRAWAQGFLPQVIHTVLNKLPYMEGSTEYIARIMQNPVIL